MKKKLILPCLVASLLLTGCNSKRDSRIAQLESRIKNLEGENIITRSDLEWLDECSTNNDAWNQLQQKTIHKILEIETSHASRFDQIYDWMLRHDMGTNVRNQTNAYRRLNP